jgi:hypothetical protein
MPRTEYRHTTQFNADCVQVQEKGIGGGEFRVACGTYQLMEGAKEDQAVAVEQRCGQVLLFSTTTAAESTGTSSPPVDMYTLLWNKYMLDGPCLVADPR